LSAEAGVNLTVETRGVEARSALDALTKLIEDGFHELPGSTSPAPNPSS
jgi:phosphotransferase system HPr-like phosphotransfer protein